MRKLFYKPYVLFLVLLFCVLLPGGSALGKGSQPSAVKGILDLSEWDWEHSGLAKLDGEWELIWSRLGLLPSIYLVLFRFWHTPFGYYEDFMKACLQTEILDYGSRCWFMSS
ncbi:hypothetical protein [Paenibacillus phytorum]|uniref:hypothetical protein n=1 Tax=Paenibacillus phytorum TaxID=2654977 RepID=UPI001FEA690A|nr:hypothetical protein [Paenibacillus phytorum]